MGLELLTLPGPFASPEGRTLAASREDLRRAWGAAVGRTAAGAAEWAVLYSGGLDSSLVAATLARSRTVSLVSVGCPGSDDLKAAERGAQLLGLPWRGWAVSRTEVERMLSDESPFLENCSRTSRSVLVGFGLALEATSTAAVACGQGADELFLGYAHFRGLSDADAERQRAKDLDRLLTEDWPRTTALASRKSRTIASPFLDPAFLRELRDLPVARLRYGAGTKPILRQLGRDIGLPAEITDRPKRAFQYGSGIEKLLRGVR